MKKISYKHIFVVIIILGISFNLYSQNELYYAYGIQSNKDSILNKQSAYPNLYKFVINPFAISDKDVSDIKKEFDKFLIEKNNNAKAPPKSVLDNASLNPIISESELIFALTDVIIDRAKQELATAYFDRLSNKMETETLNFKFGGDCNSMQIYLKDIFPNFHLLIKNSNANMNLQIGNTLISTFKKDIEDLPQTIDNKVIPKCYKSTNEYTLFNTSFKIYDNLNDGNSLPYTISSLRPDEATNKADFILNILVGISESMLKKNSTNWMDFSSKNAILSNSYELYLSLLYNNTKLKKSFDEIGFSMQNKDKFVFELSNSIQKLYSISNKITQISKPTNNNSNAFADFDYPTPEKENSNVYKKVVQLDMSVSIANDFLSIINSFSNFIKDNGTNKKIEDGIFISEQLLDFYSSIRKNQYSDAVLASLSILNKFVDESQIPSSLVQYLTLAADISQAQNVEEAKNIIDNAILPVGSYKIKRSVKFSSSINSYIGLNGGREFLDYKNLKNNSAHYLGPFLPIGVDLSWSCGTENKMGWSHSAFISIIDLGVVAGYRFDNDTTLNVEKVPDLKFKHIISPGIFYICGIKNSPISFGTGAQFTPLLRSISDESNVELNIASSIRWTMFVAVDIPLMNIAVKGRKK